MLGEHLTNGRNDSQGLQYSSLKYGFDGSPSVSISSSPSIVAFVPSHTSTDDTIFFSLAVSGRFSSVSQVLVTCGSETSCPEMADWLITAQRDIHPLNFAFYQEGMPRHLSLAFCLGIIYINLEK
jgi:hypothetical protein